MELKIFKGYERFPDRYPAEAVKYALEHKEEAVPELLDIMSHTVENAKALAVDSKFQLHFPAVFLLAYFHETKAFQSVVRVLSLPDALAFDLYDDAITEDFSRIIASVYDGNLDKVKAVIQNTSLDEFVRIVMLESLLSLLSRGILGREQVAPFFVELFRSGIDIDDTYFWVSLIHCCALIHPGEFMEDIKKISDRDELLKREIDFELLDIQYRKSVPEALRELSANEEYFFITEDDVNMLESWLGYSNTNHCLSEDDEDEDYFEDDYEDEYDDEYDDESYRDEDDKEELEHPFKSIFDEEKEVKNVPYVRETAIGRNDPCPCGSGLKYKKCCLGK